LIAISDSNDLALLKIDRYQTPFLLSGNAESLRQGVRIFAIGNPLGIKDVMTAGVVAGLKDEYVITDATILPGSSGGPLVTEDGKVVGITSSRVSQVVGGEGFGVAIVIQSAFTDFSKYIKE
jgi:S1-C subfamily serine protease